MPFTKNLNPEQSGAVTAGDGPLLLLAGAGTGKTRVLTTRIAYLIRDRGVRPGQILAVTFTNKASAEMRERLETLLGQELIKGLWLGTFHSIGLRILRREGDKLPTGRDFTIYNDDDQIALIKLILKEIGLSDKAVSPRALSTRINQAKNELISADDYLAHSSDFFSERVSEVYRLYEKRLKEARACDFGDLISAPIRLFKEHPEVLDAYMERFQHILVDEYQDTNKAQYVLMNMLAGLHRNICVVGDPDQSIYGWRGADIRNIMDFQQDWPDAEVIKLERNYRSTQKILNAANSVIKNNFDRMEKRLWTENDEGHRVMHIEATDERDEVRRITLFFKALMNEDRSMGLKDIAVFYRTNAQSRVFEEHFIRDGIPYHVVGGLRFYDRKEVKDALSYLKLILNPGDPIAFRRVVNTPARGVGKVSLDKIIHIAEVEGLTSLEAAEEAFKRGILKKKAVKEFIDACAAFTADEGTLPLHELTHRLLEDSGYMEMLLKEGTEEALERVDNLHELVSAIKDFELSNNESSLAAFLDQAALVSDIDGYEDKKNRLTLMTLHSAKGLEFPVVFLSGLEEGLFPHKRSLDSPAEMEEERRLCYVGMTRARKRLFLSSASSRNQYGETRFQIRSRFVDEIDPEFLESEGGRHVSKGRTGDGVCFTIDDDQLDDIHYEPFMDDAPPPDPWGIGMRVTHPKFGPGVIRAREGAGEEMKLTVNFRKAGPKKLALKYANLTPDGGGAGQYA